MSSEDHTLVVIAGPTAIGKTSVSIRVAQHFSTEIISADSRQLYKELKIGTACPSLEELRQVPHHFIGHLSINEEYNVSRFETDTLTLLGQLFGNHRLVIMTGGSGLYINAVCHGIDDLPDPDDATRGSLKQLFETGGIAALRNKLKKLDPDYYASADTDNPKRLLRALEVCLTTGKPYSSLRKNKPKPRNFRILKIGLAMDKEELYERINTRVDQMLKAGLEKEAKQLFPFRHLNALNTVGYKELFEYFDGKITREQAVTDIKTHSRRYAKRQMTWFRKDEEIRWFHPGEFEQIVDHIKSIGKT
jgi:tRNA dimethylallyltransferase